MTMDPIEPRPTPYEALAEIARAVGHEHRVQLLVLTAQGPQSVEQLASACDLTVANASRHLQLLRRAGLVTGMRHGKQVHYAAAQDPEVLSLLHSLGSLAQRQARERQQLVADYLRSPGMFEAISRSELTRRLREGAITLLDVRPAGEFALGHIPGAVNLPIDELERGLARLPKGQEVVAYCRGVYCILSSEAALRLRARGFQVRRLEEGFAEWKAAGLAVETV